MNYGKYNIGVRLLLLKEYFEANAGNGRIVKRRAREEYLMEKCYCLLNPPFEPYELRLLVDGVQSSKFITKEKVREY